MPALMLCAVWYRLNVNILLTKSIFQTNGCLNRTKMRKLPTHALSGRKIGAIRHLSD